MDNLNGEEKAFLIGLNNYLIKKQRDIDEECISLFEKFRSYGEEDIKCYRYCELEITVEYIYRWGQYSIESKYHTDGLNENESLFESVSNPTGPNWCVLTQWLLDNCETISKIKDITMVASTINVVLFKMDHMNDHGLRVYEYYPGQFY